MTDADTPRVPDTRWSPTEGYWAASEGQTKGFVPLDVVDDFRAYAPADAVKLGDTRELEVEIATLILQLARMEDRARAAARQRDALRADIRADLDFFVDCMHSEARKSLLAILDRDPGREECPCASCLELGQCQRGDACDVAWPAPALREESNSQRTPNSAKPGSSPRTLLGWTVPDHIAFTIGDGSYVHITCRWALEDDCSTTTAKGNLAWIEQFLRAHAHGHVVEHQPDTPCGRNDTDCGMRGGTAHCQGCRDVEPEIAHADAWARECEDRDAAAAEAAETAAAEEADQPEPSAYDMDPDIDDPDEEQP